MKLIDLTCSNCGALLQVNSELTKCICNYCGKEILIDQEVQHHKIDNAYEAGYLAEMGRQKALQDIIRQQKMAEQQRIAEQQRRAEQQRMFEQRRIAEQHRIAQQQQMAEQQRLVEQRRMNSLNTWSILLTVIGVISCGLMGVLNVIAVILNISIIMKTDNNRKNKVLLIINIIAVLFSTILWLGSIGDTIGDITTKNNLEIPENNTEIIEKANGHIWKNSPTPLEQLEYTINEDGTITITDISKDSTRGTDDHLQYRIGSEYEIDGQIRKVYSIELSYRHGGFTHVDSFWIEEGIEKISGVNFYRSLSDDTVSIYLPSSLNLDESSLKDIIGDHDRVRREVYYGGSQENIIEMISMLGKERENCCNFYYNCIIVEDDNNIEIKGESLDTNEITFEYEYTIEISCNDGEIQYSCDNDTEIYTRVRSSKTSGWGASYWSISDTILSDTREPHTYYDYYVKLPPGDYVVELKDKNDAVGFDIAKYDSFVKYDWDGNSIDSFTGQLILNKTDQTYTIYDDIDDDSYTCYYNATGKSIYIDNMINKVAILDDEIINLKNYYDGTIVFHKIVTMEESQ